MRRRRVGGSPDPRGLAWDRRVTAQPAPRADSLARAQLADSFQGVAAGVLRGVGFQALVARVNLLGFWVIGVPAGAALTFGARVGVRGVWYGIMAGLAVVSSALAVVLARVNWQEQVLRARKLSAATATPAPTADTPDGDDDCDAASGEEGDQEEQRGGDEGDEGGGARDGGDGVFGLGGGGVDASAVAAALEAHVAARSSDGEDAAVLDGAVAAGGVESEEQGTEGPTHSG